MEKKTLRLFFFIPAIFLFIAPLVKFPYGFYVLLRLIVSVSSGVIIYRSYNDTKSINPTIIVYGLILLIFNPIIPVHLSREIWLPIDFLVAAIYGYSYLKLTKNN